MNFYLRVVGEDGESVLPVRLLVPHQSSEDPISPLPSRFVQVSYDEREEDVTIHAIEIRDQEGEVHHRVKHPALLIEGGRYIRVTYLYRTTRHAVLDGRSYPLTVVTE